MEQLFGFTNARIWDEVIPLATEIISWEIDPMEKARVYSVRATAYHHKGDNGRAFGDFNKGLEIDSNCAVIYYDRGFVYCNQNRYDEAIADFLLVGKLRLDMKATDPQVHLATRVVNIFDHNTQPMRCEAFKLYMELLSTISFIQQAQFYGPTGFYSMQKLLHCRSEGKIAHYTSLHALKGIASEKRFRFYNVAYMNDPEEGRRFFEIMRNIGTDVENIFYGDDDKIHLSPAYIGSFVLVDPSRHQRDNLLLWRTYGKHDGKEATGACLILEHDGTCFAKDFKPQIGPMSQSWLDSENISKPQLYAKPALYKISYTEKEDNKISIIPEGGDLSLYKEQHKGSLKKQGNFHWCEDKNSSLPALAEQIATIKKFNQSCPKEKESQLNELARGFLDTIRFLFKSNHYREEQEVRVVQFHRYKENENHMERNTIKVDVERFPPRFYLEAPEIFRFSEVILGPNTLNVREWKHWIQHEQQNPKVKVLPSTIKYKSEHS